MMEMIGLAACWILTITGTCFGLVCIVGGAASDNDSPAGNAMRRLMLGFVIGGVTIMAATLLDDHREQQRASIQQEADHDG